MLFLPMSRWLERKKIPKGVSILLCILLFVGIIAGIIWLISWQVTDLASDATASPSFEEAMAASATVDRSMVPRAARTRKSTRATPSFARSRAPEPARRRQWRGYAAIVALTLLLALQLLLAQRGELAAQERWRPLVAGV